MLVRNIVSMWKCGLLSLWPWKTIPVRKGPWSHGFVNITTNWAKIRVLVRREWQLAHLQLGSSLVNSSNQQRHSKWTGLRKWAKKKQALWEGVFLNCHPDPSQKLPVAAKTQPRRSYKTGREGHTMMDSSPRALSPNLRARSHTAWVTLSTLMLSLYVNAWFYHIHNNRCTRKNDVS